MVLRPDRRTRRAFAGALVTVTTLALIWPASFVSGRTSTITTDRASSLTEAPRGDRPEPTVHGVGVKPLRGNAGGKRTEPLKIRKADLTTRTSLDESTSGSRAPQIEGDVTAAPVSVQATTSGAPAADSSGPPWEGMNQAVSGFEPADPWIAVSPDHVVQTVNTRFRFTNREGLSAAADVELFDFFAFDELVPGDPGFIDGVGAPRVYYDAKHNRWLTLSLAWHCDADGPPLAGQPNSNPDASEGYIWGGISLTGDPTGEYYQFYIYYFDYLPDFPALGISGDKFSIGVNELHLPSLADPAQRPNCAEHINPTEEFPGASVDTFDWSEMLTYPPNPTGWYQLHFDLFQVRPAQSPQASSNTIYFVGEQLLDGAIGATTSDVVYFTVTGTNTANTIAYSDPQDLTTANVVPPFVDPPVPVQPGGGLDPQVIDRRPLDAVWQDNILTFVSTIGCDPVGGTAENRDCARVTQLNTSTATPTRVQDMLIATTGRDTWIPGASLSQSGILHVVYTQSGSTQGMSTYDRYQLPSDPIHTLSAARELTNGGGTSYGGDLWGNVVGVAQDPRDTNAVWQGSQYTSAGGTWATRISELQTAGSTFVGIDPVRVLDSRVNNGTTGAFASSVPKTIDVAGRLGIPADAVAITGNLTVTGQQQAGYAALTRRPDPNPATSTINFPLGDNRANNVTSPLSSTGDVSITYKASPGKLTHFILDVSGYFLNEPDNDTFKTLAPVRVLDTRPAFNIGLSGTFAANDDREFAVAGQATVPANATAVTGNVTVTGQTGAGYVTLSTTPPPDIPATSTINFPVGDTRANGVTIKLSPTGTIFAVYKAAPGRVTHLIFDVTGYYVSDGTGAEFVPISPGRRMDTRFPAPMEGLAGPFSANIARTLVVEPYQGVPGNATAITGNLTVVGQQRAGFVSMTQVADNNPTTSTLNFPLGDIRANGVTGPLAGDGSVGLVYKSSGGLTHLILDITGYFR